MNNAVESFVNLCRLCMGSNVAELPIFQRTESTECRNISDKITECLPVTISEDDELPKKICSDCYRSVDFIFNFRQLSYNSEIRLRVVLQNLKETAGTEIAEPDIVYDTVSVQDIVTDAVDALGDATSDGDIEISEVYFGDCLGSCDMIDDDIDTVIVKEESPSITYADEIPSSSSVVKQNSIEDTHISQIVESSNVSLREWMSSKKEDSADMSTETFLDLILVKTERKADKQYYDHQQPHQFQEARSESSPPPPASPLPPLSPPQQQQQQEQQIIALHLGGIVREQNEQPPSPYVRLGEEREAYTCAQCGAECKNEQELAEHARVEHKAHKCPLCNKIFAHKYMMEKHVYVHSDKREHGCSQCAMSFKRECDLLSHVKRRHATKSKTTTYGCDKCEYSCGSRFGIKIHSLAHDGLSAYNCDECGKGFNSKMDLRTHKNNHIGFKPFQCDVCGNKFTRGTYLKQHRRTMHENPRSFECADCGRRFSLKSTIKNHLLRHTGENRNFTCDMCGRRVSSRNALINHQRIHTGDKRFACSICGKAYVTKLQVKRHAYLHTDSKPYECDVCGRHLATSSSLFKHLQTHWQHRLLYSCNICSKTYVSKYKLRAHIVNSHRTAYVNVDTIGGGGLSSTFSCE